MVLEMVDAVLVPAGARQEDRKLAVRLGGVDEAMLV